VKYIKCYLQNIIDVKIQKLDYLKN